MLDNRNELERAYEKFGVAVVDEGPCGLCGYYTFNPCEAVPNSGLPTMRIDKVIALKHPDEVLAAREIALPKPTVVKSRSTYCFGARCFARTLLTRRELRAAIEARLYAGLQSGVTLLTHTGTPVSITDDLVDTAFSSGFLSFPAGKTRRLRPVDGSWDDEPTEEEAWVSNWRTRSMRGHVRKAPSAKIGLRVALFLVSIQMPSSGLDIQPITESMARKNIA